LGIPHTRWEKKKRPQLEFWRTVAGGGNERNTESGAN